MSAPVQIVRWELPVMSGTGLHQTEKPASNTNHHLPIRNRFFWLVKDADSLPHKLYCFGGASFRLCSVPALFELTSVPCRSDEPLAVGYCSYHGSYRDYFGKQLTLAGIFDLYFLMSCAQSTSIFYISAPVTTQRIPFAFYGDISNPPSYACAWRKATANC